MRRRPIEPHRARALAGALLLLGIAPAASADALAEGVDGAFELSTFASGLRLATATELLPDGRAVIIEKGGRVLLRSASGELSVAAELEVDDETEKGLLNVIAHPDFEQNRELIFYYSAASAPPDDKHKISRIRLREDGTFDLSTERVLLEGLKGPDDHEQGGGLAIDATGKLLVGVGDTGCRASKPPEPPYTPANYFGTCLTNGNGKILRIDLDGSVPDDNPLAKVEAVTACGEVCGDDPIPLPKAAPRRDIWVWGVRNPWRLWVDPLTGWVWMGDVGDIAHEEINLIPPEGGRHYGWPWREGAAGHPPEVCRKVVPDTGDCVDPAYYCRQGETESGVDGECKSINGGLIVDDCRWPEAHRGLYYFADNANGRVWTLTPTEDRKGIVPGSRRDFGRMDGLVVDLDAGPDGGLYLTVMGVPPAESRVLRIAPRSPRPCADPPVTPAAAAAAGAAAAGAAAEQTPAPDGGAAPPDPVTEAVSRSPALAALLAFALMAAGLVAGRKLMRRS